MDALDLHPEELFDKIARGEATADEQARVEAHLASCGTCRFEQTVRADFEAVNASVGDVDDLVARALMGAATPSSIPPRRRKVSGLLIAAVVLMGFGSFAAVARFTNLIPALSSQPTAPEPVVMPAARSVKPVVAQPPPLPVPVLEEETLVPPPMPLPSPVVVTPRAKPIAVPAPPVVEDTPAVPEPDALSLFGDAQRARLSGNATEAIRGFRALVARFPQARESRLANVELGRLLRTREPESALNALDAYLVSGDSTLREDALAERAAVLEQLGRLSEAREAWNTVLREDPRGLHAARARARLESLAH